MADGQTMRGAGQMRDALLADLDWLHEHLTTAAANIRRNPGLCADELERAAGVLQDMRGRVEGDLARMLRRRADLDAAEQARQDEIAALRTHTARLDALLAAIGTPPPAIIPFPQDRVS